MSVRDAVFPLVPRRRLMGLAFGTTPGGRRGVGSDVAGSRPYVRGDSMDAIDWSASARRLGGAGHRRVHRPRALRRRRAPRRDGRRPASGDGAHVARTSPGCGRTRRFARRRRWSPTASPRRAGSSGTSTSRRARTRRSGGRRPRAGSPGRSGSGTCSTPRTGRRRTTSRSRSSSSRGTAARFPGGSFLFVLSDFLAQPARGTSGSASSSTGGTSSRSSCRTRSGSRASRRSTASSSRSPARTGACGSCACRAASRRSAAARTSQRRDALLDEFAGLGIEPVLLSSADHEHVLAALMEWAANREFEHGRGWR